jgi:hypothetical protein
MALRAVWVGGTGHYPKNDLVAVESSLSPVGSFAGVFAHSLKVYVAR